MKHLIQYAGYALTVIHFACATPAVVSFAVSISLMWLMQHKTDRCTARQMWNEILVYTKKVYE
jgi:hypothetical protein